MSAERNKKTMTIVVPYNGNEKKTQREQMNLAGGRRLLLDGNEERLVKAMRGEHGGGDFTAGALTSPLVCGQEFPVVVSLQAEPIERAVRGRTLCVLKTPASVREILPMCDKRKVLELCQGHKIDTSFDIGSEGRCELRILPSAFSFFRQHRGEKRRHLLWSEVAAEILRGLDDRKDWIHGTVIRKILNCSAKHVSKLVMDEWLEVMPGTRIRRGPNGSPKVKRGSFMEFLKSRRI
jgi:hypothetical protein